MKLPKIDINQEAIKAFFKTDRGILLISMGISLFFWLLIKLSNEYPANRHIHLEYEVPEGLSFVKMPPTTMKVTLEGRGWDLMSDYFRGGTSSISFELNDNLIQNIGNNQIYSKITNDDASSSLKVPYIEYSFIPIQLGKNATKKVPVFLEQDLTFAPEHHLKAPITITPDSVTVSGPESLLEECTVWSTSLLTLKNLKTSIEQPLKLQTSDKEQLNLLETMVQVHIPVEHFTEKSIFLPVTVKNGPDSLDIFPKQVKISFVVGLSQYDSIAENQFQLMVDLKDIALDSDKNTAPIFLTKQSQKVKNVQFSPKSVSFYVQDSISNAAPIKLPSVEK